MEIEEQTMSQLLLQIVQFDLFSWSLELEHPKWPLPWPKTSTEWLQRWRGSSRAEAGCSTGLFWSNPYWRGLAGRSSKPERASETPSLVGCELPPDPVVYFLSTLGQSINPFNFSKIFFCLPRYAYMAWPGCGYGLQVSQQSRELVPTIQSNLNIHFIRTISSIN